MCVLYVTPPKSQNTVTLHARQQSNQMGFSSVFFGNQTSKKWHEKTVIAGQSPKEMILMPFFSATVVWSWPLYSCFLRFWIQTGRRNLWFHCALLTAEHLGSGSSSDNPVLLQSHANERCLEEEGCLGLSRGHQGWKGMCELLLYLFQKVSPEPGPPKSSPNVHRLCMWWEGNPN